MSTRFWVGVTDTRWFNFLRARKFDEVNFWQPSAKTFFSNLVPGSPFFFKLKRPYNHIGGYGTFLSYVRLPMSLAWETFGEKNGAGTFEEFSSIIRSLRSPTERTDPEIGCTLIDQPRFFQDDEFADAPSDWASNLVRGRGYEYASENGQQLLRLLDRDIASDGMQTAMVRESIPRFTVPYLARARLGQGSFRALLTHSYSRKCAITGENILPVLEAAHIKPYSQGGPHMLCNGLLLRSDFHKLFDLGYITVTREFRVEVSARIREEWFNGKAYYRLHGEALASLPADSTILPAHDYVRWHNEHVFRA